MLSKSVNPLKTPKYFSTKKKKNKKQQNLNFKVFTILFNLLAWKSGKEEEILVECMVVVM